MVEWCRRQGLGPLLLTGRSFGTTALCYAAEDSGIAATVCTWAAVAGRQTSFAVLSGSGWLPVKAGVALTGEEHPLYFPEFSATWRGMIRSGRRRHIAPRPLLVIHRTADQVVPSSPAELTYRAAGAPKRIERIPGADHRFSNHQEAVWRTFFAWLDRVRQEG